MTSPWIYLDNNATTPCDKRVVDAMMPYFTETFANPGSSHLFGLTVEESVDDARDQVARFIGSGPHEIVFTSGATESVNMAIKGFLRQSKRHIVTFSTEHKAVLDVCRFMSTEGFTTTCLNVDHQGNINLTELKNAIRHDTLLVAAMFANNETGVLHPIAEVARLAHEKGALLLCDATQVIGKIPVDVKELGIDVMAFSAHKFYGPKGVGGLYISSDCNPKPHAIVHGGGQQRDRRSGTLNVPGIIGLAKACTIAASEMENDRIRIGQLRDRLEKDLLEIEGSFVNGSVRNRLYNTTNLCFPGIDSERLIMSLQNISVSNGAACSAVSTDPSHVLKAMGLRDPDALASIRFSPGRFTTAEDIQKTVERIVQVLPKLRNQ